MALVRDPRTGQLVEVPDASPAATMQAAANQPVTGPRGVVGATPAPATTVPVAPRTAPASLDTGRTAPGEYDVTPGLRETLASQPSTIGPTVRFGVQPPAASAPASVAPPTAAPVAPAISPAVSAAPVPAAAPSNLLGAEQITQINNAIASSLSASRPDAPIYQPAERGNYNMYNTAALPKPQSEGINFGFGVDGAPTAREVLDRYEARDQAAVLRQREALEAAQQRAQLSNLRDLRNDPVAYRQALREMELTSPTLLATRAQQTQLATDQSTARTARETAALAADTAVRTQAMGDIARLAGIDLTGQYGVAAADITGQAKLAKIVADASTPAARKAAAEAALLETQLNAIRAGVDANQLDTQQVIAATRGGQERSPTPATDPLTGVPYTPEEIALIQRRRVQQLQSPQ